MANTCMMQGNVANEFVFLALQGIQPLIFNNFMLINQPVNQFSYFPFQS